MLNTIHTQVKTAAEALVDAAGLQRDDILVVGCSSSEIIGSKIGSNSSPEVAGTVFTALMEVLSPKGIWLAAQCCEHLNRALILEKEVAKARGYEIVSVVPWPKAGGSFATMAYKYFENPVAVEHIKAEAGMDIGDTIIGMHLRDVAVPVRLSVDKIGNAHLVCARTRPKYIGGERAHYE